MQFDSYHPAVHFLFFGAVLVCTVSFTHPVFLAVSYTAAFLYSVKLLGKRSVAFHLFLLSLAVCHAFFYASYHHFGVTVLGRNPIGNSVTLEALVYGAVVSVQAAAVISWFFCIFEVFCCDGVVYLFGRVCPKFAMFFSILLRLVPRILEFAGQVNTAQSGIGRGIGQGSFQTRRRNFFRIASIVATWTMESLIGVSDSMKSRGAALKGRSAFAIYRFDYRDRCFVLVMSALFAATVMGALLDQAYALYDPEIILNRVTPASVVFYAAYAFFCLLPLLTSSDFWIDKRVYML